MSLTLFLVGVAAALVCALAAPAGASAAPLDDRALLARMNTVRQQHGAPALRYSPRLARAALGHSRRMVTTHTFAHGDFMSRITASRYLRRSRRYRAGENLAWSESPTPAGVVDQWLASPPHRRTLLDPGFRHVGLGIASGTPVATAGATVTADFGSRA